MPITQPAQFLDQTEIQEIIRAANRTVGLSATDVGAWPGVQRLLKFASTRTAHQRNVAIITTLLAAGLPFGFSQFIPMISQGPYRFAAIISAAIVSLLVVYISIIFPKDLSANALHIELIRSKLVTSSLAGQLALHNFVQEIFTTDDQATIAQLSELLNVSATKSLTEAASQVSELLTQRNADWEKSYINLIPQELSEGLQATLANIARSVANASTEIFNGGSFVVKIYVRTSHDVDLGKEGKRRVELLTAVGRYPSKTASNVAHSGKSWIKCMGVCSDVWTTVETGKVQVFRNVKSERNGRTYKSIACIPLPQGLGAVTIESSAFDTFTMHGDSEKDDLSPRDSDRTPLFRHNITEELWTSISVAVKTLIVRAVKANQK